MENSQSRGTELAALAGLFVLLCAILAAALCSLGASLRHAGYASGWLLMAVLLAVGLIPSRKSGPKIHVVAGIAALALFGAHMNFGLPDGGYEVALAGLFIIVSASGIVGRAAQPETEGAPPARWRYVHVSLTWALLGFALLHGILMHAHGLMAAWLG